MVHGVNEVNESEIVVLGALILAGLVQLQYVPNETQLTMFQLILGAYVGARTAWDVPASRLASAVRG